MTKSGSKETKYPINLYLSGSLPLLSIMANYDYLGLALVVYSLIISILFYFFFARYSGKVILYSNSFKIKYFIPWTKNVDIELNSIQHIKGNKGFYDYFSENTIAGLFVFPIYCYDIIEIIDVKGNTKNIKINTRIFSFDSIVSKIAQNIKQPIE